EAVTSLRCYRVAVSDQDGRGTNRLSKAELILGTGMSQNLSRGRRLAYKWQLQANYNIQRFDLDSSPLALTGTTMADIYRGYSPSHQFSLRLGWSPNKELDLDAWFRLVDEAEYAGTIGTDDPSIYGVDGYRALDLRAAWRPYPRLELAVVGKNLLSSAHEEYVEDIWAVPMAVPRSVMATLRLDF
ncbi:MAG: TonB-dependent receptor, partial [Candidatus Sedimenticola sp. (ex Thyasira tokunagai)]